MVGGVVEKGVGGLSLVYNGPRWIRSAWRRCRRIGGDAVHLQRRRADTLSGDNWFEVNPDRDGAGVQYFLGHEHVSGGWEVHTED